MKFSYKDVYTNLTSDIPELGEMLFMVGSIEIIIQKGGEKANV